MRLEVVEGGSLIAQWQSSDLLSEGAFQGLSPRMPQVKDLPADQLPYSDDYLLKKKKSKYRYCEEAIKTANRARKYQVLLVW